METKLLLKVVGNYRIKQGEPQECHNCHNAHWGTILVTTSDIPNGDCVEFKNRTLCLECLIREKIYYTLLSDKYSDVKARAIAYKEPNKLLDGLDIKKLTKRKLNGEKLRTIIVKHTSEMLDNPDKYEIYPTTKFYNNLIKALTDPKSDIWEEK